jgi:SAM-dependent methyltransferase
MKIKNIIKFIKQGIAASLANDEIRTWVGLKRFYYFKKNIKQFPLDSSLCLKNTLKYNLKALNNIQVDFSMKRMKWLIFSVLAIESTNYTSKFLFIGPRTENEILFLKALGYKNVFGIDIISYSPLITLGDMHKIPFKKSFFDIVICGWTLPYSTKPEDVINEILRVIKKEGIVAFGIEHVPSADLKKMLKSRKIVQSDELDLQEIAKKRINTCDDIIKKIGRNNIKNVFFNHDAPLKGRRPTEIQKITGLASSQTMISFQIK